MREFFGRERRHTEVTVAPTIAFAACASIGAGAIHAAAIGTHSEHHQAVVTFTIIAILQLGWGAIALVRSGRALALVGAAINLAAVGGWLLAKTKGISFIDGLETSEGPQAADTIAFVFAAVATIGAFTGALVWRQLASWFGTFAFAGLAIVTTVVTGFGMVAAGNHTHAHGTAADGHTHSHDATATAASGSGGDGHVHGTAVVPPKEYDPTKPIDLGGVPGVSQEEQARAENLIAISLLRLPKYSDYRVAEKAGFVSIGDGVTGDEHFINTAYFNDGHILDPDYPESLVYDTRGGGRKLAAAMYMMPPNAKLTDVPNVGGKLTQWHIHNNLCFTVDAKVAGLTNADGSCNPPLVKGSQAPMIHVWIVKHECGPFAALEGVGAGQILPGQQRACDQVHA